jgi:hypothetical protein
VWTGLTGRALVGKKNPFEVKKDHLPFFSKGEALFSDKKQ